jgi:hypothetical protein
MGFEMFNGFWKLSSLWDIARGPLISETKKALEEISKSLVSVLVAGEGFEPTTFGL